MSFMPDPTFYPSPGLAMQAAPERIAYVSLLNVGRNGKRDAMGVINVDPSSSAYGQLVGQVDFPNGDNELHHFGWNACSAHLCPHAAHPHVERRYLIVPGINSSRIHIIDTKPDPRNPKIVKVIEPETLAARTGYASPHTIHCGPDGILVSALGAPDGGGPGGLFVMDHESFDVLGKWELDRGPQKLSYDFWWHLGFDTVITSEWGTPSMVQKGVNPEILLKGGYGHKLHVWDLQKRRHQQEIDLGPEFQMALELRPAHDATRAYGFLGVVVSLRDLSASIWVWHRDNGKWSIEKVIDIPAEPAGADGSARGGRAGGCEERHHIDAEQRVLVLMQRDQDLAGLCLAGGDRALDFRRLEQGGRGMHCDLQLAAGHIANVLGKRDQVHRVRIVRRVSGREIPFCLGRCRRSKCRDAGGHHARSD